MTSSRHPYTYDNFMQMLRNTRIERPKVIRKVHKQTDQYDVDTESLHNVDSDQLFDDFDSYVVVKHESIHIVMIVDSRPIRPNHNIVSNLYKNEF